MKKGIVAVTTLIGVGVGAIICNLLMKNQIEKKAEKVDKFKTYYNMLNQWLILKQEGKSIDKYFINNNYKTIAIYGMGELGCRLYEELEKTDIQVKYAIDKNPASTYAEIEVVDLESDLEEVDVIVVSAAFAFDEIRSQIEKKVTCNVVSLEDILYSL